MNASTGQTPNPPYGLGAPTPLSGPMPPAAFATDVPERVETTATVKDDASGPVSDDPAAIRADIDATRAALGDTVEALMAKTDVRARARESAQRAGEAASVGVREMRRRWLPMAAGGVAVVAFVVAAAIARRGGHDAQ